jgi:hypothetical protein
MAEERTEHTELQPGTAHTNRGSLGRHVWVTTWVVVILPLLYFLSVGPALKLKDRGIISESVVLTIYAPLFQCAESSPPFRKIFIWYVCNVWRWRPAFHALQFEDKNRCPSAFFCG